METYENFCKNNQGWDSSFYGGISYGREKDMERNYEIAHEVEAAYKNRVKSDILEPKIGDIVEFSDGFHIYKHAKIVEDLYGENKHGMLCICENGSSHVSRNAGFSTSGGAFVRRHKSRLQYVGKAENLVWTWGCNGAGASQGIYFTLTVNKWIIPYDEKFVTRSTVKINGKCRKNWRGEIMPAVEVWNIGDFYMAQSFESIKAYKAWADFIGYKTVQRESCLDLVSNQKLVQGLCVCRDEDIDKLPKDAVVIKCCLNGKVRDCWVYHDGNDIIFRKDNRHVNDYRQGTKEYEDERKMFRKYCHNPLGV